MIPYESKKVTKKILRNMVNPVKSGNVLDFNHGKWYHEHGKISVLGESGHFAPPEPTAPDK